VRNEKKAEVAAREEAYVKQLAVAKAEKQLADTESTLSRPFKYPWALQGGTCTC
jgi:hypothetical protein